VRIRKHVLGPRTPNHPAIALAHGRDENERSTVINHLRGKLATVPGATLILQASQELSIGGRYGNAQYQYTPNGVL
jgi:hypothetical protein